MRGILGPHVDAALNDLAATSLISHQVSARGRPVSVVERRQGRAVHPGLVTRVIVSGADFEPATKRIATFGYDGTLSSEQIVDFIIVGSL
jgi:hypothetical protein